MGNCISVQKDSHCFFCNKELSYRYLKCDKCNINFHYNCAYINDHNGKKCYNCMENTLRPLLDNEIDQHRRNTI